MLFEHLNHLHLNLDLDFSFSTNPYQRLKYKIIASAIIFAAKMLATSSPLGALGLTYIAKERLCLYANESEGKRGPLKAD